MYEDFFFPTEGGTSPKLKICEMIFCTLGIYKYSEVISEINIFGMETIEGILIFCELTIHHHIKIQVSRDMPTHLIFSRGCKKSLPFPIC